MKIDAVVSLFMQCTPSERAEILHTIRGKTVESRTGVLTRDDVEAACRESRTLNEVAERLGVSRRTLQYHMRLLGMRGGGVLAALDGE